MLYICTLFVLRVGNDVVLSGVYNCLLAYVRHVWLSELCAGVVTNRRACAAVPRTWKRHTNEVARVTWTDEPNHLRLGFFADLFHRLGGLFLL